MKLFISSTLLLLELSAMKTKIFPLTHNDFLSFVSLRKKKKKKKTLKFKAKCFVCLD